MTSTESAEQVATCLARIDRFDRSGPMLRSVLAVHPDALAVARERDAERDAGRVRGPLHGKPILVKDNIDTVDLPTTAGSLALVDAPVEADATLVTRLREAGTVLLGKTNLSEWANFRSSGSTSGWSAVGGLCRNPHAPDRSSGGSSAGSAAAVAAGITRLAIGTETDGSIVCPASLCGVVGLKPTVGLVPAAGIVPISHSQDTAGPIAATVREAAALLDALTGRNEYAAACDGAGDANGGANGSGPVLRGVRIGVPRDRLWGYSPRADAVAEAAIERLARLGATIVDPADIPSLDSLAEGDDESVVLHTEFKADLETYLATRPGAPQTLEALVEFNREHAAIELRHFGQTRFERALESGGLDDPAYLSALANARRFGREDGIDAVLRAAELDALVAPAYPPAWTIDLINGDHVLGGCTTASAVAGYPILTVPAGTVDGLPIGLALLGTAGSEATLLRLGHRFERDLGLDLRLR